MKQVVVAQWLRAGAAPIEPESSRAMESVSVQASVVRCLWRPHRTHAAGTERSASVLHTGYSHCPNRPGKQPDRVQNPFHDSLQSVARLNTMENVWPTSILTLPVMVSDEREMYGLRIHSDHDSPWHAVLPLIVHRARRETSADATLRLKTPRERIKTTTRTMNRHRIPLRQRQKK